MRSEKTYQLLVNKMHEVAIVPPQNLGPFTVVYKKVVPYIKFYPWFAVSLISFVASLFLYLLLGSTLVRFVSILQFGF
jgi:hypothetical protein